MSATKIDWNPYPEETPQSGDNYLVTVIDQTDHKTRYVGTALFLNVTGWNVSSRYRVIAWANLPEPYQPEAKNETHE